MMQVSVVVLPEPAGPVTSTRPFDSRDRFSTASGISYSLGSGRPNGITRMIDEYEPRWRNTFARKRPTPAMANEKSSSWFTFSDMMRKSRSASW